MPVSKSAAKGERVSTSTEQVDPMVDFDDEQIDMSEFEVETVAPPVSPTPFSDVVLLRTITGDAEPAVGAPGVPEPDPLQDMIRAQVAIMMEQELAKLRGQPVSAAGTIPFQGGVDNVPVPPSYTHHYRCDASRDLIIQELDMSALDVGMRPQASPIPGSYIRFRVGHIYLDETKPGDANKIRQLEYMRNRAAFGSDGETVLGGNPSIYEDDGADIFRCTQGCDYITASKNAWKAHMRATHQVEVN